MIQDADALPTATTLTPPVADQTACSGDEARVAPADGNYRLLVVEDDHFSRDALQTIFARRGWTVRVAGTVADGLALLDSEPTFSGVILDLMLPDGDGETVLRKVRADHPETRVAVCTGTFDPARLGAVSRLGPRIILQKPITLADVFRALAAG